MITLKALQVPAEQNPTFSDHELFEFHAQKQSKRWLVAVVRVFPRNETAKTHCEYRSCTTATSSKHCVFVHAFFHPMWKTPVFACTYIVLVTQAQKIGI